MFGWGPNWHLWEIMQGVASFLVGIILFLIWLAVIVLFVRFLLIGTRAAKVYLRNHGENDGVLPQRTAAPATTTAPAAAATTPTVVKPAPRTRTPKPPAI